MDKSNFNTSSNLLKRPGFLLLLAIFLVTKLLLALFWPSRNVPLASDLSPENILNAVNKERSLRNLVTLSTNSKLGSAAQSKSDDMQARHYFAHVDPDGHYIWDKIVAAGYSPYVQLGENLAIEFYDTESLMSAWMNSPTHRANIIQEGFRDQGMGLAFGNTQNGQYHSAITNTFGAQALPKTPTPPKIINTPPPVTIKPETPVVPKIVPTTPQPTPVTIPTPPPATDNFPPIAPRQAETLATNQKSEPNFTLNQTPEIVASSSAPTQTPISSLEESFSALVGQSPETKTNSYNINRYLILICGVALLLLMLSDLKSAVEKKLGSLDKKFNNLAVLLISIIVIAFMYWL
ncbi:MAG: CAP domain-containing protein [Candidatus Doudnabacteria bacterium]|jgi:hypothetical protein